MRPWIGVSLVCLSLGVWAAAPGEDEGFARYQVILGRQPFARPPVPKADRRTGPVKPKLLFTRVLRMIAITEDEENGLQVGIVDTSTKSRPAIYYLAIGEKHRSSGLTLVEADYKLGAALLRKGSEEAWINMKPPKPKAAVNPEITGPIRAGATTATAAAAGSYVERLRERMRIRRAAATAARGEAGGKPSSDDAYQQLRAYNLDLIRAGRTALPIRLTPEEDTMLVNEGVLPAPVE